MDVLVVGAGVVGLACARALALRGHAVIVAEKTAGIGNGVSSRNSEVIHAGMYYPTGSVRARHCVAGRRLLYAYCAEPRRAAQEMRQAHCRDERPRAGQDRGHPPAGRGERRRGAGVRRRQRAARHGAGAFGVAAVHSPETGIVDSHAFMLALQGDLEDAGGVIAFNTTIERLARAGRGWEVHFGGAEAGEMPLDAVVNSASLGAQALALRDGRLSPGARAEARAGEGQLFRLPRQAGLFAPDLSGAGRRRPRHAPDARSCRPHALRPRRRVDRGGGL